eukprot:94618-Lingulodinium_polyedra.AAC.1
MRFAGRCGGARWVRPHRCVAFCKRGAAIGSNRTSAVAAARKSHVRALHARASFLVCAWRARACDL